MRQVVNFSWLKQAKSAPPHGPPWCIGVGGLRFANPPYELYQPKPRRGDVVMVQDEDLEAAVAEGIRTQAQVDRLRAFALHRLSQSAAERADEERFRFLKGFNDFFFAVGVALVGTALSLFAGSTVIANLLCALLIWLLAEVLLR